MNLRSWLLALLPLAAISALAALGTATNVNDWPAPAAIVLLALSAAVVSLVGIWIAMGHIHLLGRLCGAILACFAVGWFYARSGDPFWLWWLHAATHLAVVAVLLFAARLGGLQLRDIASAAGMVMPRRTQFSLRHLMGWITVVAVLLALCRTVYPRWLPGEALWNGTSAAVCFGLIGAGAALAMSTSRRALATAWLFVAIAPGAGYTLLLVMPSIGRGVPIPMAYCTGLQALLIVGALIIFRLAGYRLAWRTGAAAPADVELSIFPPPPPHPLPALPTRSVSSP